MLSSFLTSVSPGEARRCDILTTALRHAASRYRHVVLVVVMVVVVEIVSSLGKVAIRPSGVLLVFVDLIGLSPTTSCDAHRNWP